MASAFHFSAHHHISPESFSKYARQHVKYSLYPELQSVVVVGFTKLVEFQSVAICIQPHVSSNTNNQDQENSTHIPGINPEKTGISCLRHIGKYSNSYP